MFLPGVGAGLGAALASAVGDQWTIALVGIGLLLGGVGTAFLGQYLNVSRPRDQVRQWSAERSAQWHSIADAGQFHLGPGYAAPRSVAEAHAQADQLVATEEREATARTRNRHTLFFIPIQWVGLLAVVCGLVLAIGGILEAS